MTFGNNSNEEKLWFKRKAYGWGWTPVTWEGWLVILVYVALMVAFGLTLYENSPVKEIVFTFLLPVVLLSIALIRICYRKGEKPRWQWGKRTE
jgi:hypothetical protein